LQNRFEDFVYLLETRTCQKEMGFEEPTPIQSTNNPLLLKGKDLMVRLCRTGKTAAFGIPIIEKSCPQ
jgi:ATP-dependent RNA helicase DeaD